MFFSLTCLARFKLFIFRTCIIFMQENLIHKLSGTADTSHISGNFKCGFRLFVHLHEQHMFCSEND